MFNRFIDDGFGIMRGNKKDVETWINECNNLRENIFIDNGVLVIMLYVWTCIYSREIIFMQQEN